MFGRRTTIELEELSLGVVLEAIDRERKRLKALADEARDQADRDTWAFFEARRRYLHWARSQISYAQVELGELSPEAQEAVTASVQRIRHQMPRSKANASILRREREQAEAASRGPE